MQTLDCGLWTGPWTGLWTGLRANLEGGSLNSLDLSIDLRNGGVALDLENFNRLNCTLAVLFSVMKIDSSLLPPLVPSLK